MPLVTERPQVGLRVWFQAPCRRGNRLGRKAGSQKAEGVPLANWLLLIGMGRDGSVGSRPASGRLLSTGDEGPIGTH